MRNKKLKTIILGISIGTIISINTLATNVFASDLNRNTNILNTNVIQEINDDISQNISIDNDQIKINNTNDLLNKIDDADINKLNELAKSQGIEKSYTKEDLIKLYEDSISNLNKEITQGNLEMLSDGSIIEANDDSFYLQGGSTFDKRYWWGVSRWKSTDDANHWSYELNKAAAANAGIAVLAGAVLGGVGAIPNGLTSAYTWALANEVSYKNSLNSRGIVADINWSLVYSVYGQ